MDQNTERKDIRNARKRYWGEEQETGGRREEKKANSEREKEKT